MTGKYIKRVHFLLLVIHILLYLMVQTYAKSITRQQKAMAPIDPSLCNCQCDPFTYVDEDGIKQGNCISSDGKAKWCYISSKQNVCKDALPSSRWTYGGRARKWSYIACSTPDRNSPICEEHFKGCPDICQSLEYTPDFSDTGPVCGTDDKTYSSECALETASCKYKNGVEVAYPGNCVIPLIPICKTVVKNENNPAFRTPAISDTPLECQFPFTYDGEVFNTCTRKNSQNGKPWCATATNKLTGEVIRGNWGDCDKNCIASGRWPEEQATDQISTANVTQLTPNQMYNSASSFAQSMPFLETPTTAPQYYNYNRQPVQQTSYSPLQTSSNPFLLTPTESYNDVLPLDVVSLNKPGVVYDSYRPDPRTKAVTKNPAQQSNDYTGSSSNMLFGMSFHDEDVAPADRRGPQ